VFPDGAYDSIRRRDVNEDINPSMRPPGGTRSTRSYSNCKREVADDTVANRDKLGKIYVV